MSDMAANVSDRRMPNVFSNLQMEGPTLRYSLRKPFELLQQVPRNPEWRPREDKSGHWEINVLIT